MRIVALIFGIVVVLVGAFLGYCYYGAQMQIESVGVAMVPAAEALELYEDYAAQRANGSFLGTIYQETELAGPEEYAFLMLTARIVNPGVLPMDWITIEVAPNGADIAQLPQERTPTLASGTRSEFGTTLLTRSTAETARTVTLTYYVLGHKFSVTHTM